MTDFVCHNFTDGPISMVTMMSIPCFGISLRLGLRLTPPSVTIRTAISVSVSQGVMRSGGRFTHLLFYGFALLGICDFVLCATHFFIRCVTFFVWYLKEVRTMFE